MNKEYFTARYDPRTDKIEGCTEGTKEWHHEDRHRQQFKDQKIQNAEFVCVLLDIIGKVFIYGSLMALFYSYILASFLIFSAAVFFAPGMVKDFYLEADAIIYARKMSN